MKSIDNSDEKTDPTEIIKSPELTLDQKRLKAKQKLLESLYSGRTDSVHEKVALILKLNKKARNSDIDLLWEYWRTFEPDKISGNMVSYDAMFQLSRLMSISRARSKIQNEYHLFEADDVVKKRRGKLEEEKRNLMLETQPDYPIYSVYMDESGKTSGNYLLIGSIWFVDSNSSMSTVAKLRQWKLDNNSNYEFHFAKMKESQCESYKRFFDIFLAGNVMASFKAVVVKRAGIQNTANALNHLTVHLLREGIIHEDLSGNACLPRRLEVCVDSENIESDNLRLSAIRSIIASQNFGDGKHLHTETFEAVDSSGNLLIQIADLFAGSINRKINVNAESRNFKDEVADYILNKLGVIDYGEPGIDFENNMVKILSLSGLPLGDVLTS